MDDHEVLRHLLSLEADASALVDGAHAEADRRVSEGEKQNRLLYEDAYAREVESLEAGYVQNITALKDDFKKQLDAYRKSLETMPVNTEAFYSLAEKLLLLEEA